MLFSILGAGYVAPKSQNHPMEPKDVEWNALKRQHRINHLKALDAPEIIVRNEQRMLDKAIAEADDFRTIRERLNNACTYGERLGLSDRGKVTLRLTGEFQLRHSRMLLAGGRAAPTVVERRQIGNILKGRSIRGHLRFNGSHFVASAEDHQITNFLLWNYESFMARLPAWEATETELRKIFQSGFSEAYPQVDLSGLNEVYTVIADGLLEPLCLKDASVFAPSGCARRSQLNGGIWLTPLSFETAGQDILHELAHAVVPRDYETYLRGLDRLFWQELKERDTAQGGPMPEQWFCDWLEECVVNEACNAAFALQQQVFWPSVAQFKPFANPIAELKAKADELGGLRHWLFGQYDPRECAQKDQCTFQKMKSLITEYQRIFREIRLNLRAT